MPDPTTSNSTPSPVHHPTPTEEIRTLLSHIEGYAREMTATAAPLKPRQFLDYLLRKHHVIEGHLQSIEWHLDAIEQSLQTSTPNSPPVVELGGSN